MKHKGAVQKEEKVEFHVAECVGMENTEGNAHGAATLKAQRGRRIDWPVPRRGGDVGGFPLLQSAPRINALSLPPEYDHKVGSKE